MRTRLLSLLSSFALVAAASLVVPPAPASAAPDQSTQDVTAGLDQWLGLAGRLGNVGALAQPVPGLNLTPGGPSGLDLAGFYAAWRAEKLGGWAGVDTLDQVVAKLNGAGGTLANGRGVTITASKSTVDDVTGITVTLTVNRTVTAGLSIASTSPPFSFASTAGVQATLSAQLAFTVRYDASDRFFFVDHGPATPALTVGVNGTLAAPASAKAALGILGVELGGTSTLTLTASITGKLADPDGDHRLAFAEPGGMTGELAAAQAEKGLGTVAIAGGGSLDGTLVIVGTQHTAIANLPSQASATVSVNSDDLATQPVTVSYDPGALDPVQAFMTLSNRDLADGLAQLAASLRAAARARDAALPFMRGAVSDALMVEEALLQFLKLHVVQPPSGSMPAGDRPAVGAPDFASIQDLMDRLAAETNLPGGARFTVGSGSYDAGDRKLRLTVTIARSAGDEQPLDAAGATLAGSGDPVSYTDTTVKDTTKKFTKTEGLVGRQIVAGTSSAIIGAVLDDTTLQLSTAPFEPGPVPASRWQGGTPAAKSPYSISGLDPRTGQVELGAVLGAKTGIKVANATAPLATVKPSYTVTLPLVLDLQPPRTDNCNPAGTPVQPCPYQAPNPGGTATIVASLPLPAQRLMLHTGGNLFTADAPISTAVDITANAGFLQVKIAGSLRVCTTGAPVNCDGTPPAGNHLVTLGLEPGGDADGDISLPDLFRAIQQNPTGTLNAAINGQAYGDLRLSVPGAPSLLAGDAGKFTLTLADLTNPGGANVSVDFPVLRAFDSIDPSNPQVLFGVLLAALREAATRMHTLSGTGVDVELPVVGRKVSDLLGATETGGGPGVTYTATKLTDPSKTFTPAERWVGRRVVVGTQVGIVADTAEHDLILASAFGTTPAAGTPYVIGDELTAAVDRLTADPTPSLQELVTEVNNALGPQSAVSFDVAAGTPPTLVLTVDWQRAYRTEAPLSFDFSFGGGSRELVGTNASGTLKAELSGQVKLVLRIPLEAATVTNPLAAVKVDPAASQLSVRAKVDSGPTVALAANLGPLAVSLGKPGANPTGAEAHIDLGFSVKNTTDTSPVPLGTFLSHLDASFTANEVTCAGLPADPKLAACAKLPVYIKLGGSYDLLVPGDENASSFILTVRKDATSLAPAVTTPSASALQAKLDALLLDLTTLGDGLDSYLRYLDLAIEVANAGGSLPVVGDDLQQGKAFLEKLRNDIRSVLGADANGGNLKFADFSAVSNYVNNQVKNALPAGAALTVGAVCSATLAPATGVSASVESGSGTTSYAYRIVATRTADGTGPTLASGPASVQNGTLGQKNSDEDPVNKNRVQWTASQYADHYLVLRSVGGAAEKLIATVTGTSFVDDGSATESAVPALPASQPMLKNCPGASITGLTLAIDMGQGDPASPGPCNGDTTCHVEVPLDLGLPGLSIKATGSGSDKITGAIGWRLHLKVGLSRDSGFFIHTQDEHVAGSGRSAPELRLGASLDLPDEMQAQLAFIRVDMKKRADHASTPLFKGMFSVDLRAPGDTVECVPDCPVADAKKLTLGDLTSTQNVGSLVVARLSATADIAVQLRATATSALPGIQADFLLRWVWTSNDPGAGNLETLRFENVKLDPGQFLGTVLKPIFDQINDLYEPIKPIVDTIKAPIPVLSDLSRAAGGGDVSLLTIATAFSTLGGPPVFGKFVDVFLAVERVFNALPGASAAATDFTCGGCISIGGFDLNKDTTRTTVNSPDVAPRLLGSQQPSAGRPVDKFDSNIGLTTTKSDDAHPGFTFPALEQPSLLFGLVLGQDVALAEFDSGPLTLGFSFSQSFGPVYAPPPVFVTISGSASVSLRIAAGFDTFGLRHAFEEKKAVNILNSLYFKTVDAAGKPIPVVEFSGSLAAGAMVSAFVISVGIEGGITLTISFTWNDPTNDGKFRFFEFLTTALNNPLCLFNVGGRLSVFVRVFIKIGICPFCAEFSFTLVNATLLEFKASPDCKPPPPVLADRAGGVLYLFAGKLGTGTLRGHSAWDNSKFDEDEFVIRQAADGSVTVTALGISRTFTDVDTVLLDGRDHTKPINVTFAGAEEGVLFTKKVIVVGGSAVDTIRTGNGVSLVDGRGQDDTITTADRPDLREARSSGSAARVAGGAGGDTISVGNGDDWVAGDSGLVFSTAETTFAGGAKATTIVASSVTTPGSVPDSADGDGHDVIAVGLGDSDVFGGGGGDTVGVAADNPQGDLPANTAIKDRFASPGVKIVGGTGGDRLTGGSGPDEIYTGALTAGLGADEPGSGDADADVNAVDTGTGTDLVHGSNGIDLVTGHSTTAQVDTFYGHGGADVLMGSYGKDVLYGGPADDVLAAEPSTVGDPGSATDVLGSTRSVVHLPNPHPPAVKLLVGGGGSDRLYGGDGGATIYGDHTVDGCAAGTPVASDAPGEHPVVSDPPNAAVDDAADVILGGNGIDTVNAGGGNDHVTAFGGNDLVCGNAGGDTIDTGGATDQVWGGTGGDTVHGGPGVDSVYGNAGNDTAYGGTEDDTIEGNADVDTLFGGEHDDTLFGGTQAAGRGDTGDFLYGDGGADVLVGDNGVPVGADAADPFDLDGAVPAAGGSDRVFGGPGPDHGYGGLADDTLSGSSEDDALQGNNGTDIVLGGGEDDDLTGGSSQQAPSDPLLPTVGRPDAKDFLFGNDGQDVILGDNGVIARVPVDGDATPVTRGRGLSDHRQVGPYDLGYAPVAGTSGGDEISGGDSTDLIFGQGGVDTISAGFGDDYAEGGQAGDVMFGDAGEDDLTGGSVFVGGGASALRTGQLDGGDEISGGLGGDVAIGDNGALLRIGTPSAVTLGRGITGRSIDLYDLAGTVRTDTFGADLISGGGHNDVLLGQGGTDRARGDADHDYVEGGQAADWVEGNDGDDDLVGGGATVDGADTGAATRGQADAGDVVFGGAGDDVVLGDNAVVTRVGTPDSRTLRVNAAGVVTARRALRLLDLESGGLSTPDGRFGGDQVSGGSGVDVLFGQDGGDAVSGGPDDDYAEGNGADDRLFGDRTLSAVGVVPPAVAWPGAPSDVVGLEGDVARPDGQDDLLGGSPLAGFRDAGDEIHGDGAADFALGDNGTVVRDVLGAGGTPVPADTAGGTGPVSNRIYVLRYASPAPAGAAFLRHGTRFCATRAEGTCERPGAYGDDQVFGEGGDDTLYGQDGNDTMRGGDQDDDMYGELGDDRMFGDAGEDAMLGDRGGVVDKREDGSRTFTFSSSQVPRIDFTGFVAGTVTRHTDLRHDVDGDVFVGGPSSPAMVYDGVAFGGNDRMRGGTGHDSMHGGVGDDLMNGDSGGDIAFGDDGADVMWGGKGSDDPANPNDRGAGDSLVDYLAGGAGATSGPSTNPTTGSLGSDVLDFQPRGTFATCTSAPWPGEDLTGTVVDPCAWFEMTSMDDADATNDQHHHGIDWMYGGWDRDVLQADVADNGPNQGDRLLDWNGAYNLYTHCNSAYGGYNDVRQHSPTMQQFLLLWAGALGTGQGPGDVSVATTAAYDELAFVYQPDVNAHGSGPAFPQTPGHFYDLAC